MYNNFNCDASVGEQMKIIETQQTSRLPKLQTSQS